MSWKKWPKRRSSGCAGWNKLLAACTLLCFFASGGVLAADKIKDLQDHFDKDTHAGSKLKLLDKLTDAQFDAASKAIQANDYVAAAFTYEKYRDNVRAALELLKKQEPDADRHPNGYRQLELQVRHGMRELQEVQLIAPADLRPPLGIVLKDLTDMDDELIRLLFPRRTKDPEKVPSPPVEEKP
jgi:hypothetical protein